MTFLVERLITPKRGESYIDQIFVSKVNKPHEAIEKASRFPASKHGPGEVKRIKDRAFYYSLSDQLPPA